MFDAQQLIDSLSNTVRFDRSESMMTLGKLTECLSQADPDFNVVVRVLDGGESRDCMIAAQDDIFGSYRGYYADIAIREFYSTGDYDWDEGITVGMFLKQVGESIGSTFIGYKGGEYKMDERAPVWLADYGSASGIGLLPAWTVENTTLVIYASMR